MRAVAEYGHDGVARPQVPGDLALVTYVEVPFGYALQLLILKEAPTAYQCVGSAVIVCACAAHTLLDTKKAH